MRYGLLRLDEIIPPEHLTKSEQSFIEYAADRERHVMSK